MPFYYFNLRCDGRVLADQVGTELSDDAQARQHSTVVARELLRNNEARARNWSLEVCGPDHQSCFEFVLADFDESLNALSPDLKNAICRAAKGIASLSKEIASVQQNMQRLKNTIRRSDEFVSLSPLTVFAIRDCLSVDGLNTDLKAWRSSLRVLASFRSMLN